jgi:AraC-like DNA-binding protein
MEFVTHNRIGCPLGCISMAGESSHAQVPPMARMRNLGKYALVYLFEGSGRYRDERGRTASLSAGDCLLLFPDIPHHYGPDGAGDWSEFYIVFDGPVFDLWRRKGLLPDREVAVHLAPPFLWLKRLREVVDARRVPSAERALEDICRLQALLAEIRSYRGQRDMVEEDRAWLQSARALLEGGSPYPGVARSMGVSYDRFRKRFARLAGMAPGRFRQGRVIDRAGALLCQTRRGLADIADELGFCDEFHFSRTFKKVTGLSPSRFRRQYRSPAAG